MSKATDDYDKGTYDPPAWDAPERGDYDKEIDANKAGDDYDKGEYKPDSSPGTDRDTYDKNWK